MTLRLRSLVLVLSLTATSIATAACAGKTINHVLADPSRYRDREVTISGNVIDSYSIVARGIYQVQDDTGQLWVASDKGVPSKGARVQVTGTIREGFNLGALANLVRIPTGAVVMVETSHRTR